MKRATAKSLFGAVIGGIAGVVATGPMTVAMILWHRWLPARERYALPPREITMKLAHKAGLAEEMNAEARLAATLVAHFGYGGLAGAIYGASSEKLPAPAVVKGIGFGLLVWAGSYLGHLPSAGILQSATKHPARRNLLMIGAHVVWGVTVGSLTELLVTEGRHHGRPFSDLALPHRDAK